MATQVAEPRVVGGRQVPPVGRWSIDLSHSEIQLTARHMMVAKVRGRFREFSAVIEIAEVPEASWIELAIEAASIDTGDPERDRHLRSPDFLDVERYPQILFRSGLVEPAAHDRWQVSGDLTIRGVTRVVLMDVEFAGAAVDPWGGTRAGFSATTEINREEFDITWTRCSRRAGSSSARA